MLWRNFCKANGMNVVFCALLMLVERFKKSDEKERKRIYDFYLSQTSRINNWDLVDLSAPGIVGEYLKDKSREEVFIVWQAVNCFGTSVLRLFPLIL